MKDNKANELGALKILGGNEVDSGIQQNFVNIPYHSEQIVDIIQSYAQSDVCIIGPRSSGKSTLVFRIAHILNQTIEPLVLYQDMSARDLIQQRTTTLSGDTIWQDSPLIRAAKNGHIGVLDGLHRVHNSTISFLHR